MRILIVCTHNSVRSVMAEAFLRKYLRSQAEVVSAGTHPSQIHPLTLAILQERGIDFSHHRPRLVDELAGQSWDYVITVCDAARESCPYVPARHVLHRSFPDPTAENSPESFRRVCHQIEGWARNFVESLASLA